MGSMCLFSLGKTVTFVPPLNFLIFVPQRFLWDILRRRGCLWTPRPTRHTAVGMYAVLDGRMTMSPQCLATYLLVFKTTDRMSLFVQLWLLRTEQFVCCALLSVRAGILVFYCIWKRLYIGLHSVESSDDSWVFVWYSYLGIMIRQLLFITRSILTLRTVM